MWMAEGFVVERVDEVGAGTLRELAEITMDAVEGGASIGFMWPLPLERAQRFWQGCAESVKRGERVLLVAREAATGVVCGTVQLIVAMPDNQPHRADVAKMQVHRRARRRGLGAALMRAVEQEAVRAGKTLLVLDTVSGSDAERLYVSLGWEKAGEIPEYALGPRGGLLPTTVLYRRLSRS